jgi:O-antigen ligase
MIIAICSALICLIPIGLVLGPLIPELIILICTALIIYAKFNNLITFSINYNFIKINVVVWFILLVSALLSNDVFFSLKNSFFYFRFFILSIIISIIFQNNVNIVKQFYNYLLTTFLIVAFFALLQLIFINYPGIELFFYKLTHLQFNQDLKLKRISGLFGKRLIMGSFIVRLTPLYFGLFLYLKDKLSAKSHFFFYITTILNLIMLILAGERTSMAMLFIFLSFLFIIFYKFLNLKKTFLIFLIFILFVFSFLYFNKTTKYRLIEHTYYEQIYKDNKLHIFSEQHEYQYKAAWKMYLANPVFGIGPVNYRNECSNIRYYDDTIPLSNNIPRSCTTHPHNILIQIMAETGTIGLVIYIAILMILTHKIILNIRNYNNNKIAKFNILITTGILINLFPFIPSGNIFNNWLMIILFTPIGMLFMDQKK